MHTYFYNIRINNQKQDLQLSVHAKNCKEAEKQIKKAIQEMFSSLSVPDTVDYGIYCTESTVLSDFLNTMILRKTKPELGEISVIFNVRETSFTLVNKTKEKAEMILVLKNEELKYSDTDAEYAEAMISCVADEYDILYLVI